MLFNSILRKKALSIKEKMIIYILVPITVIFLAAFTFVLIDFQSIVKDNTEKFILSTANNFSVKIENELSYFIELNRFLKQNFESFNNIPMENRRTELSSLMHDILEKNPKVVSIWSIWELNSIDTLEAIYANKPGSTILGNFRYLYYRENGEIKLSDYVEQDPNNVFNGKLYNAAKSQKKEVVVTHFYLDYNQTNNQVLQTNIVMPLYSEREFLGVVGVDMELENIQDIIQNIGRIETGETFLFSNNGMCISSPKKDLLGKQFHKIFEKENLKYNLSQHIKEGKNTDFYFNEDRQKFYYTLQPVKVGKTNTPWSLLIKLPYNYIKNQTRQSAQLALLGGFLGTVLILIIIIYISNNISKPLIRLKEKMDLIGKGEISETYVTSNLASSEIQDIAKSYNKVSQAIQNSTEFAQAIKKGNLDSSYQLLGEKDQLGKALIEMRNQLKESVQIQETKQEEERKRYWVSDGLTKLNELLRKEENIEDLSFNILSYLINYLNANQGGIFIRNNDDQNNIRLELKAFYAFDRRKFLKKSFEFGEGLVGNCALEKQTIHLREIPQNYIEITSGLGGSNPKSLLLIPMKIEEDVLGIIEIASFNDFEEYQIDFLEQASLSIASSLNMVETNKRTKELLEKTQQQAEEMAAQEEEMRQNMEELQATQEESSRRADEFEQKFVELQNERDELEQKLKNYQ